MLNKFRQFIFYFCFSTIAFSQSNLFLKTFSSLQNHTHFFFSDAGIDTLSQNSFITGGCQTRWSVGSNDTLTWNSFLQKTEISGLTKWHRNYHLNGYELSFTDLKVLPNKDILVSGKTTNFLTAPSPNHGTLMQTDSNGYVKWFRLYPSHRIYKLLSLKNGNIAVLATENGTSYGKNLKISLLNQTGNLIWCKKILSADTNECYGTDLVEGKNKSILIVGSTTNQPLNSFLILFDSLGNKINDLSLVSPLGSSSKVFYKGVNYLDKGFYVVGVGKGNASNITGSIIKLDNSLNMSWYKLLQTQLGHSEFMDINVVGVNNLIILCEPENYGTTSFIPRAGLTFIDSNAVARKSFLFTTDTFPIIPINFLLLKNGNTLFSAMNPGARYFGITDTISNGFCAFTQINYPNIINNEIFNFNTFSTINSVFNYSITSPYLFQPTDIAITYYCSNGPSGPLDPTNTTNNFHEFEINECEFKIFPNPSSDFLILTKSSKEYKTAYNKFKIKLINSFGEIVLISSFSESDPYIKIDVKKFNSGMYNLFIESDSGENYSRKIIVRH
ncbi:MAG: T9SS type A sorting domain-containing protein [Bacteroidetes bacterium]|nr:T9SS type A sorting domain-containing protein [Bacteroidota bacterium]MCA6445164.1 T9SS type A sorting domain-containing protein [Bacteroidota bacterium]